MFLIRNEALIMIEKTLPMKRLVLSSTLFFVYIFTSLAQDTHHWNNQFGTRAALLGGAVLTDTIDNAGVYYNPGNLAFLDTSSLSINANLYGLENIEIQNALGQAQDFKGLQFNTVPLLISGTIKNKSKWNLSYGLITPVSFKFNGNARIDQEIDLVPEGESPGLEELVSESGLNTRIQETSLILGIGKKLNSNLGFGLSLMNTLRSVDFTYRFSAKTLTNGADSFIISRTQNEFTNYFSVRTALKTGINYQGNGFGLALTAKTPGISWLGNGTVAEDLTLVNLRVNDNPNRISAYASDRQEKLKAKYKAPFELSLGGHKAFNNSILSLNVTHFGGIKTYRIIEAKPGLFIRPETIISQDFGSEDFLNVETAMKPVTNFSIGYETRLKSGLKLMGSFRSDFSYFDPEPTLGDQIVTEITQWDIFHLSLGTVIEREHSSLTIGLVYSFGSTDDYFQENSFTTSQPNPPLEGALTIVNAKYTNFGLLIGYSFRFKKFN